MAYDSVLTTSKAAKAQTKKYSYSPSLFLCAEFNNDRKQLDELDARIANAGTVIR